MELDGLEVIPVELHFSTILYFDENSLVVPVHIVRARQHNFIAVKQGHSCGSSGISLDSPDVAKGDHVRNVIEVSIQEFSGKRLVHVPGDLACILLTGVVFERSVQATTSVEIVILL